MRNRFMKQAIAGVVAFDEEITVMVVYPSIAGAPGGIGKILGRLFNIQIGIKPLTVGNLIALASAPLCAGLWIGRVLPMNRLPLIGTLSKKLGLAPQRYRITTKAILSEDAFDGSTIQETIALDSFDEIEIAVDAGQSWYDCGDLIFKQGGAVTGRLESVSRPESFKAACIKSQMSYVGVKQAI